VAGDMAVDTALTGISVDIAALDISEDTAMDTLAVDTSATDTLAVADTMDRGMHKGMDMDSGMVEVGGNTAVDSAGSSIKEHRVKQEHYVIEHGQCTTRIGLHEKSKARKHIAKLYYLRHQLLTVLLLLITNLLNGRMYTFV